RGHLSVAREELKTIRLDFIPTVAIAKEFEKIYLPDKEGPIVLPPTSGALRLVQRIRNEAHRFAISYHRDLRARAVKRSELDEIKGIGEKRKRELLKHFGSVEAIKKATAEELMKAPSMNKKSAEAVLKYFHE
ncbi:MAG: helix-hairpin-helix domain-containing protein, partial [Candidatus Omnitrophota bacterium]